MFSTEQDSDGRMLVVLLRSIQALLHTRMNLRFILLVFTIIFLLAVFVNQLPLGGLIIKVMYLRKTSNFAVVIVEPRFRGGKYLKRRQR